jgi:hypothetical protein
VLKLDLSITEMLQDVARKTSELTSEVEKRELLMIDFMNESKKLKATEATLEVSRGQIKDR